MRLRSNTISCKAPQLPIDYAVKFDLIALLIDRSEATWDIVLCFTHDRMCMSRHLLADMRILLCSACSIRLLTKASYIG